MIEPGLDDVAAVLAAALDGEASTGRLSVDYQVMVELWSGRVVGAEALARLQDGRQRTIAPDVFVPVAEHTGLITELGRHVLDTACSDLAGWRALGPAAAHMGVSVNVSAHQAASGDLVGDVRRALRLGGLPPQALTVELTETVLVRPGHPVVAALHRLRALGVGVAIDDFGSGYAGLSHLLHLPVTALKIDRSFTAGLPTDPISVAILCAVAGLARELGLGCVVEGVETDTQREVLESRGLGALIGQGYLLGRPVPAGDIAGLLATPAALARL